MHRRPNAVAVLLVVLALALAACGPGEVAIQPAVLRCDDGPRTLTFRVPDRVTELVMQIRAGDPNGRVIQEDRVDVATLAQYREPDGSYRISTEGGSTWECEQPVGPYVIVMADAASGAVIGTAPFQIAR